MTQCQHQLSRRRFLARTAQTVAGGLAALSVPAWARANIAGAPTQASLISGDSRGGNVLSALRMIEEQIKKGIARKKRVIIKPNVVVTSNQLAASHVECLEAILDFLKPIYKDQIIIGDSPAGSPVTDGFENYDYYRLAKKYNVKFIDFDAEPTSVRYVSDHCLKPQPVRCVNVLLDPDTYIISAAIPKTHDRAVVTLSLKNIVVGAAVKDPSFRWGQKGSGRHDKSVIHGGPHDEAINYNIFKLAKILKPDLSVLDGFEGMEGNGPAVGTPVDHKIAIASTDFLAADRIAVELMGFDFAKVGYLSFCAQAGMGQGDLAKIDILGEKIANHIRQYRPHDTVERQYKWMTQKVMQ